ncbi:MAG TPA: hypothetical protein VGP94_16310 [Tepidisphaeraceae bacterium]|nr:hypothetical protein [Tepidisphaeraceae bacterium]
MVSILAPLLVIAELDFFRRFSIQCGIVGGVAIIWLNCVFNDTITPGEWLRVTLVLLIYTLAIAGLAAVVARIRIPPAVIVILSLAWLSWPIWLAPALRGRQSSERTVAVLVAANPTFAIQGALSKSFNVPWAQYRIAYRLTNIGDDISYDMPRSILFCVMVHGIIAAIAMLAAHWPTREPSPVPPEHPPADQSPRST